MKLKSQNMSKKLNKVVSFRGLTMIVAISLCLFFSFTSCHREPIYIDPLATINLKVYLEDSGEVKSKGAVESFFAKVYLAYEDDTSEFTCYFSDPYNTGYYSWDPMRSEKLIGVLGTPFRIIIEATVDGAEVRGESEIVNIAEQSTVTVSIELRAGYMRIGTRSPRTEDIFGRYVFVGGEVYELENGQPLLESGIICIPQSAYDAMQSPEMFTFENGVEQISGFKRTFSEYEGGANSTANNCYRFEMKLTGLTPETNYSIRAYALVGDSYRYGRVVNFRTIRQGPEIKTYMATDVTKVSLKLNAQIFTDDGSDITERGFIVSHSQYFEQPQTYECGSGLGEFNVDISGLNPCTRIYYKSYAKNSDGTYYGNRMSVCTYEEFTDVRDNSVYKYVRIGSQYWMSENMRYLPRVNGVMEGSEDNGQSEGLYFYVCRYDGTDVREAQNNTLSQSVENVPSGTNMYNIFGVLYNARAAQTACPSGWHLPSDMEWSKMEVYLQNNGFNASEILDNDANRQSNNYTAKPLSAGMMWSSTGYDNSVGMDQKMNNSSSFGAVPGGYRGVEGGFYGLGKDAYWWTSTSDGGSYGYGRSVGYTNDGMKRESYPMGDGFSVRCVKD